MILRISGVIHEDDSEISRVIHELFCQPLKLAMFDHGFQPTVTELISVGVFQFTRGRAYTALTA